MSSISTPDEPNPLQNQLLAALPVDVLARFSAQLNLVQLVIGNRLTKG